MLTNRHSCRVREYTGMVRGLCTPVSQPGHLILFPYRPISDGAQPGGDNKYRKSNHGSDQLSTVTSTRLNFWATCSVMSRTYANDAVSTAVCWSLLQYADHCCAVLMLYTHTAPVQE